MPPSRQTSNSGGKTPRELEEGSRKQSEAQDPESAYPNYTPGWVAIMLQLAVVLFLVLVWALQPSARTAIVAVGEDFVGVLRKCSGTSCDSWLQIEGITGQTATSSSSETDTPRNRGLARRAGTLDDSIDYSTLYLNTGIAVLTAFYMSIYVFLFLIIRRFKIPSVPIPPIPENQEDEKPKKEPEHKWNVVKRFAYRASRCLEVILVFLILGCLIACGMVVWNVREEMQLKGSEGIGGGMYVLLISFLIQSYIATMDISRPRGTVQRWLTFRKCFPNSIFCLSRKKWKDLEPGSSSEEPVEINTLGSSDTQRISPPPKYSSSGSATKVAHKARTQPNGRKPPPRKVSDGRGGRI